MSRRFHVTKSGRTEPCTATVKACPLGEANHFGSPEEAINASLMSAHEMTHAGKTAPYELREFFVESKLTGELTFDSRAALRAFAEEELGVSEARSFMNTGVEEWSVEAIELLAHPSWEDNEEWRESTERRSMNKHLPKTLARLEEQADRSYWQRQLAS